MAPRKIYTLGEEKNRAGGSAAPEKDFGTGLRDAYYSFPPVTRTLLTLMVLTTSLALVGWVPIGYFVYSWTECFRYFQFWRMVTACFILPGELMQFIFQIYLLYSRSKEVETGRFLVSSAVSPTIEYTYYLLFSMISISILSSLIYGQSYPMILTAGFDSCLACTWAIDNINKPISLFGVLPITGKYIPVFQLVTSFIFNPNSFLLNCVGIFVAYLFNCLDTRTLGPVWGWLTNKPAGYGVFPAGKFGAPGLFVTVYELCFGELNNNRQRSKMSGSSRLSGLIGKSKGQRLGSLDPSKQPPNSLKKDRTSTAKKISTDSEESSTVNRFPGKGQRIGGTEEKKNEN
ncbi:hypothetical protein NCAS_0A12110 [Naumovozyma castellii]|uniref:Derlin n=1 Tax=Naumovozyma castellii TaxID=27288 RepID=G0V8H1_NAUCA|nr:hypothetical protein NCAS_0A12110 [Naumovozyma castellii CBS 4309]CCC67769.1 hypothetical protein NCAS_0A12110 [Naumovozyma castellii CBS 4309]